MKLFVSYAHVDKWQTGQLVDILRDAGHDPWFDNKLLPGQDWKQALKAAIVDCEAFVYALTPESVASEWCQWEFATAVELGKSIIPILVQPKTDIPETISRYQYADFSDGLTPQAIAKLMGGITKIAISIPKNEAPTAPQNPSGKPSQLAPFVYAGFIQEDKSTALRAIADIQEKIDTVSILPAEDMKWGDEDVMLAAIVFLSKEARAVARLNLEKLILENRVIIPIILTGDESSAIPPNLAGVHTYSFGTDQREDSVSAVGSAIRKLLAKTDVSQGRTLEERYWNTMIRRLEKQSCIPIIGPDMCGELFPSEQAVVTDWITQYGYAVKGEPELAMVAQYLAFVEFADEHDIKSHLIEHRKLNGSSKFIKDDTNSYRILARLPICIFLTTGHDDFLYQALKAEGKTPTEIKEWSIEDVKSEEVDFTAFSVEEPAVVYLLGHYKNEGSMTVLEDDFIEFIYRIGKQDLRLPTSLERLLKNNMLLLMGFRIHDWSFRATAQLLTEYLNPTNDIGHVAVQVAPFKDDSSADDKKKAVQYLEKYFERRKSKIYISETDIFLQELQQKWEARTQ